VLVADDIEGVETVESADAATDGVTATGVGDTAAAGAKTDGA